MPNAIIAVNRLVLQGFHGVMEQERINGNTFEISVELFYPIEKAMMSDDVEDTLNYAQVVDIIKQVNAVPSKLLENFIYRLRCSLLAQFPAITGGSITIAKLTPPISAEMASVSVTYNW
jgi:dihydroneopterin aldolase